MRKLSLFLLVGLVLGVSSCELKEKMDETTATLKAVDALQEYAMVTKQFQDASNSCDDGVLTAEISMDGGTMMKTAALEEGPAITIIPLDATTWPKEITLDFGSAGIRGKDGRTRKGKMIITSTARYKTPLSVHTTVFENFFQDGYRIEGVHEATNMGMVANKGLKFAVEINNGKITKPDGGVIHYTQNSSRTWVAGDDTPLNIWDDEYELEGSQTGLSSKEVNYTMSIIDPLHFLLSTGKVSKGTLSVSMDGLDDITIDYSNSTISIGGNSYPFEY